MKQEEQKESPKEEIVSGSAGVGVVVEDIAAATPDPSAPGPSEPMEEISMASEDATKETQ